MYDYAQVQLLGRATADAIITDDQDGVAAKAIFTVALNVPVRRGTQLQSKTLYRRLMVLGNFASYIEKCQAEDGLKGRLIVAVGVMDDERYFADGPDPLFREVVRVAPGAGSVKVMDRRSRNDG